MKRCNRHRRTSGFTLIEMIAVLVIIGLIVGVAIPEVMRYIEQGKVTRAQGETQTMATALKNFNMDVGRYPTVEEGGLSALIIEVPGLEKWNGPYVSDWRRIPNDPWGNPYEYSVQTDDRGRETAEVISYAKDGEPGGKGFNADIINGHIVEEDVLGP